MLFVSSTGLLSGFRLSYARGMKILRHKWLFLIFGFAVLASIPGCGEPKVVEKKVAKLESEVDDSVRTSIQ